MNTPFSLKRHWILRGMILTLMSSFAWALPRSGEEWDRQVDQVAFQAQDSAIQKLKKLIKKYKNSREESGLLMRLSEVYQESASIEFRIAFARSHQRKTGANLEKYHSLLKAEIEVLCRLIQAYPGFFAIDQSLFMRGQAYEELKEKQKAKIDYQVLVKNFPTSSRSIPAYMALAEMAIMDNQHAEAIGYLKEVEKSPGHALYPFALYKLAWSYLNLKDIPNALSHVEQHIRFYDNLAIKNKGLGASDVAIRENSLLDAVLFYLEGTEEFSKRYSVDSALDYFRSIEKGPLLGKMTLRFAKLLRSHRRDDDFENWKNRLIKEEKRRPETIEVVMNLLEYELNQNQFEKVNRTLLDVKELHHSNQVTLGNTESYIASRKLMSEAAAQLQEQLAKAGKTQTADLFLKTLSTVYVILIDILPEKDPRLSQSHYNLAEVLFKMHDFDQSTQHYRWVVTHWSESTGLKQSDVKIKAIASRYEGLKIAKWIPAELSAAALSKPGERKTLSPVVTEWINWIDTWPQQETEKREDLENFAFEANRALYLNSSTREAVERMIAFSLKNPSSKFAVPSATLAIDTYIKSEAWDDGYRLAQQLLDVKWNQVEFTSKLTEIAADFGYKLAEAFFKAKDFQKAIAQAKDLGKRFPKSNRSAEGVLLTAQALLAMQDKVGAQAILSNLIQNYPHFKGKSFAYLNRAQIAEENFDFKSAVADYKAYLQAPQEGLKDQTVIDLSKRIYFFQWVSGEKDLACDRLNSLPQTKDLVSDCEKYQAAVHLRQSHESVGPELLKHYFKQSLGGDKELRALSSAISLKFDSSLKIRDQLNMLRNISKGWDKLDSLLQISLLPSLNVVMLDSFSKARVNLRKEVPLNRATAQAITRRAEWIKEFEGIATNAMSLPWSRIRSGILVELAGVYGDFSSTLEGLPAPKDLSPEEAKEYTKGVTAIVGPFLAKSKSISERAYLLASSASVEDDTLNLTKELIPEIWKSQSDKFTKKLPQWRLDSPVIALDLSLIRMAQAKVVSSKEKLGSDLLFNLWCESYRAQSWEKTAYFYQQLKSKKEVSSTVLKIMQGLILAGTGAKSEGLTELKAVAGDLDTVARKEMDQILLSHYAHSKSVETAAELAEEVDRLSVKLVSAKSGGKS